MIKILVIIILVAFAEIGAQLQETANLREFLYGTTTATSYDNWLSHVSEGIASEGYNVYSPWDVQTNGFGDFLIASDSLLTLWEEIIFLFVNSFLEEAQIMIEQNELPFEIVVFNDTNSGNTYFMLREILNMDYFDDNGTVSPTDDEIGSFDYGWGLYLFNPSALNPIIVTVVHPNDDFIAPPVALKCFQDWDAMFLMINGAGREVRWTEQGSYTNSKSLSDPSRVEDHAFNRTYQKACDFMRNHFERREFSAQIHSFDWDKHDGFADCQISAGSGYNNPNLPIRDLSNLHDDIINNSSHLIWDANSIGQHEMVFLNDYYSVYYSLYDFVYYDDSGRHYQVNNNVSLPGYGNNRQMVYTQQGWNSYDVFEPFFHIEMDELPNGYQKTEAVYKWFYGYDAALQYFHYDQLFDRSLQYYQPWIDAMTTSLQNAIPLDDGQIPLPPQDLSIVSQSAGSIYFSWTPIANYDHFSYELLYSTEPITGTNFNIYNRFQTPLLANPYRDVIQFGLVELNQQYYFQLRCIDYQNNISVHTPEISTTIMPAAISGFAAVGLHEKASIRWLAQQQAGNLGFTVYLVEDENFIELANWLTEPSLLGSSQSNINYQIEIDNLTNNQNYTFALSCTNENGQEFFYQSYAVCQPSPIYKIIVSDDTGTFSDSVFFGMNIFATNNFDPYFDLPKQFNGVPEFVSVSFYKPSWSFQHLHRIINQQINTKFTFSTWQLKVQSDLLGEAIKIQLEDSFPDILLLHDLSSDFVVDLNYHEYEFLFSDGEPRLFNIYWGNYYPTATVSIPGSKIFQPGNVLPISWNVYYPHLIEFFSLQIGNNSGQTSIIDYLPSNSRNYNWQIPDNISYDRVNVWVIIHDVNGCQHSYPSNNETIILPTQTTISGFAGWSMITNPWISESQYSAFDYFGEEALLFSPQDHYTYQISDLFIPQNPYWLYSPMDYSITENKSIITGEYSVQLHPGWNLVPNPHLIEFEIKDLRFYYNGYVRYFSTLVDWGIISSKIYSYEDRRYLSINHLESGKSYYIYANINGNDNLWCRFLPLANGSQLIPLNRDWTIQISAWQSESDYIILGSAPEASEEFDFKFDLPHPPSPPFNKLEIFFDKSENISFTPRYLKEEFKESIKLNQPDSLFWDFKIAIPRPETVSMEFDLSELPESVYADIKIADNNWLNLAQDIYIYSIDPGNKRYLAGEIKVHTNLSVQASKIDKIADAVCYPNPFNPETQIIFNLSQSSDVNVSIYNIRGQKVKRLLDQKLAAGFHQILWKGDDNENKKVASGLYLIKLQCDEQIRIMKVLLLK